MSTYPNTFFATAPKGIAPLLADELATLGASEIKAESAGVRFQGSLEVGYRTCLWSRTASRVYLELAHFNARSADELYSAIHALAWEDHMRADGSIAVSCNAVAAPIDNSHYGALRVKDAICDYFRERTGQRPAVDTQNPDLWLYLYWHRESARIYLDLSGEALHRRGYRGTHGEAPLKENLAAAILLRAGWPEIFAAGGGLVDPCCGSGTLAIEAALIAAGIAPGSLRDRFGFTRWRKHLPTLWASLLAEAQTQAAELADSEIIHAFDVDPKAISGARANAKRAGVASLIRFEQRGIEQLARPRAQTTGLVITNPPYGARLGAAGELATLYKSLGEKLSTDFAGWQAAILCGDLALAKHLGVLAQRSHTFYNGALECRLLRFKLDGVKRNTARDTLPDPELRSTPGAEMLANRLRKNMKLLKKWAEREGIDCYRLYDADMPEYNFAIDIYHYGQTHAHVQEYAAPASIDPNQARQRRREALAVIPWLLEIPPEQVHFKRRQQQKGKAQYQKLDTLAETYRVREYDCVFEVNFTDYLDTGLFLDHRLTRRLIHDAAKGQRFLNLFGYTGSATIAAARGGARETTTIDRSNTYLDWTQRNLINNGFNLNNHHLVRSDCLNWLEIQTESNTRKRYGLIFLDPPTFSNTSNSDEVHDIQRDHITLIHLACELLEPQGQLLFSTNYRRFKLDTAALSNLYIEDISAQTIPKDFAQNPKIHRCWRIQNT
jgi:23S rRNA (guanine2445-N2)-methyltransferase / 23S rRNA (guanine2069-N7)-methyltransferase